MIKNKKSITIICIAVTFAVIFIRDLIGINIPFVVFSTLCAASSLVLNRNGRFIYALALLPFCRGIPYSEIVLIVLAFDIFFELPKNTSFNIIGIIPFVAVVIIEMLDYLYYNSFKNNILYLAAYMFFVCYAVANKVFIGSEENFILAYSFGTLFAVLSVAIREINTLGLDYIITYGVRFGNNTEQNSPVTNFNSNEMGLYCAVAVALLLVLFSVRSRILSLILAVSISMIGFLSISRSYLVVIVAVWLYYFLFSGIKIKSIFSILIIFALGIAALHRFVPELSEWAMNFLFERADAAKTDGMGGRTDIIALYFNLLFSSLWSVLFGFSTGYTTTSGSTTAAHNGFQEILVCWGMIGFVFAVSWLIILYRQMFKMPQAQKNNKILRALPLVAFWLFIMTIQLFTMFNYLFVMLISMVSITLTSEDKDKYELQTF